MSVLSCIDSISMEKREQMVKDLSIKAIPKQGKKSFGGTSNYSYDVYRIIDDKVTIPFSYCYQNSIPPFNESIKYPKMDTSFKLELFDRQKSIKAETFKILNETRSIVLSLFTGWGKTLYSIYLACKIGLKTIIFCHRAILIKQWESSIIKACGKDVKIQVIKTRGKIDKDADFYIANITTIPKRDNIEEFSHIGLVIIDEAHTTVTENYSKAFTYVFPKYLIGLTATPVRSDGKDRVIELYCGPHIIFKPLQSVYNVYTVKTGFKPEVKQTAAGVLDWNSVLSSQSKDEGRNKLLVDLCRYFSRRNILVLCKLKDHCRLLCQALKKYGVDADMFMGSDEIVNYNCRVLVCTYSKSGVGFDHPKLDMLLMAADVEEGWIQYLGRVFRREWQCPIIVDPSDAFFPLMKHAKTRYEIYEESGGQIKKLENYFPAFNKWRKIFNTEL